MAGHTEPVGPCDLGILFVHGIGDQPQGSTLVEFGTPLVEWLAERAAARRGTVLVGEAQLAPGDPGTPAYADVTIAADGESRRWLMAESWWAASFGVVRFSDLARWATAVVPWTFGSHFGVRLVRAWRAPRNGNQNAWLGRLAAAALSLLAGLVLSLVMLVALAGLLVLGLIPWERLRSAIARYQLRLAASVGDSYVLVTRPIEAAAILTRFRHNLRWLEQRCRRVAIVAHSQGGAVSCRGLLDAPDGGPRLLVTFGSGLRKLEELEALRARPTFGRSGLLAAAGLALAGLAMLGLYLAVARFVRGLAGWDSLVTWIVGAGVGATLVISGVRDFVEASEPTGLRDLCARVAARVATWVDLHASADPVCNGPLHDDARLPPDSIPVVNAGSLLRDHTSYWRSHDDFVTIVGNRLLEFDGAPAGLRLERDMEAYLSARRRARVRHLRVAWWTAVVTSLVLVVRYSAEWSVVIRWAAREIFSGLGGMVGWEVGRAAIPPASTWRSSAGWLLLVWFAYGVTRSIWSRWRRREIERLAVVRADDNWDSVLGVALAVQVGIAGFALFPGVELQWILMVALAASIAVGIALAGPKAPKDAFQPADRIGAHPASRAERSARWMWQTFFLIAWLIAMPLGALGMVQDFRNWLAATFAPWEPHWAVAAALLFAAFVAASWLVVGIVRIVLWFRRRARAVVRQPHS